MLLVFKLVTTPALILAVTLLTRRFGPVLGGLLVGIPLTTGPISFFLAQQHGAEFAAEAAVSNLVGQVSVGGFCLAFALAARRFGPVTCALLGLASFALMTAVFAEVSWNLPLALAFFAAGLTGIAVVFPAVRALPPRGASPSWDLPLRMALGAGFVLAITGLAAKVGPGLSGLIAPMPVIALVLAVFIHAMHGREAASALLRSVVLGSPAFGAFFLALVLALPVRPLAAAYGLASLASLTTSGAIGLILRRGVGASAG